MIGTSNRQLFLSHVAQTSPEPIGLEIVRAEGVYQFDTDGKRYLDLISGFNVCNIGHSHPKVVRAVQHQAAQYMHLIVYGEFIETPQVAYARLLKEQLPHKLDCVFFTNSGAEAVEGAMKLAKRVTGRGKIIAFNNSYHGSTQGALSLMGSEYWRNAFRPLLPGVWHYDYGSGEALAAIDDTTACVIAETVQAEAGVQRPPNGWLQALKQQCDKHGALLILDEIQAGFGRTGTLWAFEQYGIVPDILLLGKALGGGMPLGAFIANQALMNQLTHNPVLGHITTFGGHPVSCAAGKAALEVLLEDNCIASVHRREAVIQEHLCHPGITRLTTAGLWAGIAFDSLDINKKIVHRCIEKGLITDWFLFAPHALRFAPPLIITDEELTWACEKVMEAVEEMMDN
ncbi:MAG TPA: aspartate aminotransferase family protein [Chitinophagaceae bacterium]|nr:aspartate aminotransferase family protein [Chitinophagaceae bacterium]